MLNVVNALMAPQWGWDVYGSFFNRYSHPSWQPNPGYLNSRATITSDLFPTFQATRNFFSHAHGGPARIANASGDVFITSREIGALLGNRMRSRRGFETQNPYRFVFLDGCASARTRHWQHAFGIMPMSGVVYPARNNLGPQAFVGWSGSVTGYTTGDPRKVPNPNDAAFYAGMAEEYTKTLLVFYTRWMLGRPLAECISEASNVAQNICPLPVPGNEWILLLAGGQTRLHENITANIWVVGRSGLTVKGHNPAFDNQYVPSFQR
jgi:hypothetical protein